MDSNKAPTPTDLQFKNTIALINEFIAARVNEGTLGPVQDALNALPADDPLKRGRLDYYKIALDDALNAFATLFQSNASVDRVVICYGTFYEALNEIFETDDGYPVVGGVSMKLSPYMQDLAARKETFRNGTGEGFPAGLPNYLKILSQHPQFPVEGVKKFADEWVSLLQNIINIYPENRRELPNQALAKMRAEINVDLSAVVALKEFKNGDDPAGGSQDKGQDDNPDVDPEVLELQERFSAIKERLPEDVAHKIERQLKRLLTPSPAGPSEKVIERLDAQLNMPWGELSELNLDVPRAEEMLNKTHSGMDHVKEKLTDHLAVEKFIGKPKGKVICLSGPPGIGKTTIAKTLADATGRKFFKVSLAGVADEASIRGHRYTYVGSEMGRVMTAVKKSGVDNPLILLDELDKLEKGGNGDPASALLELLDPSQNGTFRDHYLGVEYDLSNVMFVCTANYLDRIPAPLLDRIDVIELDGYVRTEKYEIAKTYIIPAEMKKHNLTQDQLSISDEALVILEDAYTMEAGARNLQRIVATLCEKAVRRIVDAQDAGKTPEAFHVTAENIVGILGAPTSHRAKVREQSEVGRVNALAYSERGGSLLPIPVSVYPRTSQEGGLKTEFNFVTLGKLGETMEASAAAAMGYIRKNAGSLGIKLSDLDNLQVEVDAHNLGSVDGPSAGAAMTTAVISALTRTPIRHDVAMTGTIGFEGEVGAIGGLREKLDGALRAGIKTVLIPKGNEQDLDKVPQDIQDQLDIRCVATMADVLDWALEKPEEVLANDNVPLALVEGDDWTLSR